MTPQPITIDGRDGHVMYFNDEWMPVPADEASRAKVLFEDGSVYFYRVTQSRTLGGPGSGHHGHAGRPGEVGGSAPGPGGQAPQPPAATIDRVRENALLSIKEFLRAEGSKLTPEQYAAQVTEKLRGLAKDAAHYIRADLFVLEQVLTDGRFKSQHETNTSQGALNPDFRTMMEKNFFGEDFECPTECPIYGFIASQGDEAETKWDADTYGDVLIELHPNSEHTTVVWGDSFSVGQDVANAEFFPRPLDQLDFMAVPPPLYYEGEGGAYRVPLRWKTLESSRFDGGFPYIEAQYHHGLRASAIKRVTLPVRPEDHHFDSLREQAERLVKALQERGIEVRFATKPRFS